MITTWEIFKSYVSDFVWLTPSDIFWPAMFTGIVVPVVEIGGETFFDTGTGFATACVGVQTIGLLVTVNGYRRSQKRRRLIREAARDLRAERTDGGPT